jgi:hypothetical protein
MISSSFLSGLGRPTILPPSHEETSLQRESRPGGAAAQREQGGLVVAEYSAYQRGVIKRYYEHRDTIAVHKLAETISNLYLEKNQARVATLWEAAYKLMQQAGVPINQACVIVEDRDIDELAKIVSELSA